MTAYTAIIRLKYCMKSAYVSYLYIQIQSNKALSAYQQASFDTHCNYTEALPHTHPPLHTTPKHNFSVLFYEASIFD